MVKSTLRNIDAGIPYEDVVASRGKVVRAEPVLALYEQRRVHHVGTFAQLEDEICRFTAGDWIGVGSPNRADALVWVLTKLSERKARAFRAW
jgi:phage terminase large subunit-like protein